MTDEKYKQWFELFVSQYGPRLTAINLARCKLTSSLVRLVETYCVQATRGFDGAKIEDRGGAAKS